MLLHMVPVTTESHLCFTVHILYNNTASNVTHQKQLKPTSLPVSEQVQLTCFAAHYKILLNNKLT